MTKTIEERRLDFINSELGYFIEDPSRRSVDKQGNCYYRHPDDNRPCLIGKQISDKDYDSGMEQEAIGCEDKYVWNKLSKDIQNLGQDFLSLLQRLHDYYANWTDTGLSEEGEYSLNRIKEKYCGIPRDNI